MNPERLLPHSLRASSHGERVVRILTAALDAVDPAKAVQRYLQRDDAQLTVAEDQYALPPGIAGGEEFDSFEAAMDGEGAEDLKADQCLQSDRQ